MVQRTKEFAREKSKWAKGKRSSRDPSETPPPKPAIYFRQSFPLLNSDFRIFVSDDFPVQTLYSEVEKEHSEFREQPFRDTADPKALP